MQVYHVSLDLRNKIYKSFSIKNATTPSSAVRKSSNQVKHKP